MLTGHISLQTSRDPKQELLDLESHWLSVEDDPVALEAILASDFLRVVPAGIITKDGQLGFMRSHPAPPQGPEKHFEDMHVRIYGDIGIVNGMVVEVGSGTTRKTLFTDVFAYRDGKWQAVNAQELPGAPKGRPSTSDGSSDRKITNERFQSLMQTVAEGWNRGDARLAASCFDENAVYSGPPSPPHHGRAALYEFFGGANGRPHPMRMAWHNLVFDPIQQVGAGEYSFQYEKETHGLVIVKISDGLILNWREYDVESNLPWDQFIGDNRF